MCKKMRMFSKFKKYAAILAISLSLVGCMHLPSIGLDIKPSKAEQALVVLNKAQEVKNKELEDKNRELDEKIKSAEATFKSNFDSNISLGTASVMAGFETLVADPVKSKFTIAAIPAFEVAIKAFPQPTFEDYKKTIATQHKLLSDQASEIEAGKAEITAQKGEALAAKEAQKKALDDKANLEKEKAIVEKEKVDAKAAFENEKQRLTDLAFKEKTDAIAAEKTKADKDAAERKDKQQRLLLYILMAVGVISGVLSVVIKGPGQLFNPIFAMVSGAAIGLAVALTFLPIVYVGSALGVLFLAGIVAFIIEFKKYRDIAKVTVGATQDHRNVDPAAFKEGIGTNLKEWTGGNAKLESNIDKLAKDLNVK